jgi:hypothetical protein
MFCRIQGPRIVGWVWATARCWKPKRRAAVVVRRGFGRGMGELTDSAEEKGDEVPGAQPDEVDEMGKRGEGEQGEEEVSGYVAWSVMPEDDDHGPVNHGTEGGAIVEGGHMSL